MTSHPSSLRIRFSACLAAALAALSASAVDYWWTGNGGDGLWTTVANWDSPSQGTPATAAPKRSDLATCHFDVPDGGLTVTQDFKTSTDSTTGVILSNLVVTTSATVPVAFTIVSSETKAFLDFTNKGSIITVAEGVTLTLNTYPHVSGLTGNITKNGRGVLVFDFKGKPQKTRPLIVSEGKAVVLATSQNPRFTVRMAGSDPANPPLFENQLPNALYEDLSLSTIGGVKLNGTRVKISDISDSPAINAVAPILDEGTLYYGNEHISAISSTSIVCTVELDRADLQAPDDALVNLPFDDASDSTGIDELAVIGSPFLVSDTERGNVLSLNGSSGFKGGSANNWINGFTPKNGFTVAFWLKPNANVDTKAKILWWGAFGTGTCSALRMNNTSKGNLFYNITSTASDPCYIPVNNLHDGAWHHIAIVYVGKQNNKETFLIYYDGSLVHRAEFPGVTYNPTLKDFCFGNMAGFGWGTGPNYVGLMDDFLLASRALSAEEIASVKNQGAASITASLSLNDFVANSSGVLSVGRSQTFLNTLSGTALAGGVEMTKSDSSLTIGTAAGETNTVFQGTISGTNSTLVKAGADYALTFSGKTKGVTNIVVDAGSLLFSKPLASAIADLPEPIIRWTFDGENPLADMTGNPALTLTKATAGNGADPAADVTFESGEDICGKAARFKLDKGFLRLETFPEGIVPVGDTNFSVIVRYRPDTKQAGDRGAPCIVGWGATDMNAGKLFRMGTDPDYGSSSISVRAIIRGSATIYSSDTLRSKLGNERMRWYTAAFVYRKGGECRLFSDGARVSRLTGKVFALTPEMFSVGSSWIGNKDYTGLIDDIQVYNCALSDEQASKGLPVTDAAFPVGVLEDAPAVTVASGATLNIASTENIGNLSGAGAVEIASGARLNLAGNRGFSGTLAGDGIVGIADNAVLDFGDGSTPLIAIDRPIVLGANVSVNTTATEGRLLIAQAPSFTGVENLASWTATINNWPSHFIVSFDGKKLYLSVQNASLLLFM